MASTSGSKNNPKRVIIRVHEHWHDDHQKITQDWFHFAGYSSSEEEYDWTTDHYVHLGGVNDRRFHVIIDMEKNGCCTASQPEEIALEFYRLRKPVGQASKFEYINPETQKEVYMLARQFTKSLTWGHD
ncbi:hypothetical protein LTR96_010965 [Exophiala xenobiotica]|nr:hypothetical protein LTR41_011059 [Exophiala xenobiotica]KAK5214849.1 hypothetical protein LTR72_012043 [Exophiala xenobiotica]KAK5246149.1 hypothetical protein LTS06_008505 [Exophiala xenobiotica]KAK5263659.1 hypothetical protein LTR96_010965 [Exophiala xenobiotica]KAK5280879.1 hypothetical protein LTR14_012202 [Exophiala xenobiotica]